MCDLNLVTETKEHFKRPQLKKTANTRSKRFEQLLWQELYDEYIQQQNDDDLQEDANEKKTTEYIDKYCKEMPLKDDEAEEAATNLYPLYSTAAITLWNDMGDVTRDFKKRPTITRPVEDNAEQFG